MHSNKNNSLIIIHYNIRSLLHKFSLLKDNIIQHDPDVILFTETWLNNQIDNDVVSLKNYRLFRYDRLQKKCGGVAIYIKSLYNCSLINYLPINDSEQLWISLNINRKSTCIGVVYNPHISLANTFLETFENCLSILAPKFDNIFIGGDFNIDCLKIQSSNYKKLNNIIESYGLLQLVNEPTRIQHGTATIIDLFLCSENININECSVIDVPNMSDHNLVLCKFDLGESFPKPLFHTYRSFRYFDRNRFYNDLENSSLDRILYISNIDEKVELLNSVILDLFNHHAPVVTSRITKKRAPWLTENIKQMMTFRQRALQRFKKTKHQADWLYYKTLRNYSNTAIRNEKRAYLQHQITLTNYKTLWKDLKDLNIYNKSTNTDIPDGLHDADKINQYFVSSQNLDEPDTDILNFYKNTVRTDVETFNFKLTTNEDVLKFLHSIKTKVTGCDNLNINMILYCCPYIVPYLTHIINSCIEKNYFPTCWKVAHVIPLPKVKNPSELKDLRPISILPVLSKLIEKILNAQIREHLNKFDILPETQSGFRPNHSCATALLKVTDDVLSATDNNELTVLILLDYSKAFDRINHRLLLAILHYYGLSDNAVAMIKNYLGGRQQQVKIKETYSHILGVNSGVPQGSILGPLLFTIYTSNLGSSVTFCRSHCYADDYQLYFSFSLNNLQDANLKINSDLKSLLQASDKHLLTINPSKSTVMLFGRENQRRQCSENLNISINNEQLKGVDSVKNLGLHMDYNLRFDKHVTNCIKKAYCNLKLLYSCGHILNVKSKLILCNSLVLSHFNYSDVVYSACLTRFNEMRIQRVQNACVRFVLNIRKYESVKYKIKELNSLNMYERRMLHCCCLYQKIVNTKTPTYLYNKLHFVVERHDVNTRSRKCQNIIPPRHSTTLFERSFTYNIYKYSKCVSDDIKKLSPSLFKIKLKNLIFNNILKFD